MRHSRHLRSAAAFVALGAVLGGCSSTPSMPSSFQSLFGKSGASGAAADASASAAPAAPVEFECPSVNIRQGASTLAVSNNKTDDSALNMRYQVGIGQTARECKLVGNIVTMKVGMQGRVVVGPAGGAGQIDVPIRYAVVHEGMDAKTIVSKLDRVNVQVPAGDGNVLFTHVEEDLSFPMPRGDAIDSYVVYVGFDPIGAKELDKKRPAPKATRPLRQKSAAPPA